jgi:hypothetical protein
LHESFLLLGLISDNRFHGDFEKYLAKSMPKSFRFSNHLILKDKRALPGKSSFDGRIEIVHKMDRVYTIYASSVSTGVGIKIIKGFYLSTHAEK